MKTKTDMQNIINAALWELDYNINITSVDTGIVVKLEDGSEFLVEVTAV